MTRHPINAFFRRGQPIPLTFSDFTKRAALGSHQEDRNAMGRLRECGFICETVKHDFKIYELTDAGVQYARAALCIRVAA